MPLVWYQKLLTPKACAPEKLCRSPLCVRLASMEQEIYGSSSESLGDKVLPTLTRLSTRIVTTLVLSCHLAKSFC